MIPNTYQALIVSETADGRFIQSIQTKNIEELSPNEVLVRVHYSSLNYKDALSATGNKGVTKSYPHTPGIDAAGTVVASKASEIKVGEKVIVSGYDLGMNTNGGFGEYIAIPSSWIVKLPQGLSFKETMIIGTAGFTAAILVSKIIQSISPTDGDILVTGATGGVGSATIILLTMLGYKTVAVSGKKEAQNYLQAIGTTEIIDRKDFLSNSQRPMLSARYAGAIDTVGGAYLSQIVKSLQPMGIVATCGSVAGAELSLTVFPFILRGVSLIGVSAQNYPIEERKKLWEKLSTIWKPNPLFENYQEVTLTQIIPQIQAILDGKVIGRIVIRHEK